MSSASNYGCNVFSSLHFSPEERASNRALADLAPEMKAEILRQREVIAELRARIDELEKIIDDDHEFYEEL